MMGAFLYALGSNGLLHSDNVLSSALVLIQRSTNALVPLLAEFHPGAPPFAFLLFAFFLPFFISSSAYCFYSQVYDILSDGHFCHVRDKKVLPACYPALH